MRHVARDITLGAITAATIAACKNHEFSPSGVLVHLLAIQAKYSPFLKKGNSALVRQGMRQYRWGKSQGPPGPVSLSGLRIAGVFDDVKYFIAVATAPGNDRGSWPAPVTEEDWHRCEELFREFNELAPTWIELGVLNP